MIPIAWVHWPSMSRGSIDSTVGAASGPGSLSGLVNALFGGAIGSDDPAAVVQALAGMSNALSIVNSLIAAYEASFASQPGGASGNIAVTDALAVSKPMSRGSNRFSMPTAISSATAIGYRRASQPRLGSG